MERHMNLDAAKKIREEEKIDEVVKELPVLDDEDDDIEFDEEETDEDGIDTEEEEEPTP